MKPLELSIYPIGKDHFDNPAYLSADDRELYMPVKDAEYGAMWKHLEDGELAAEFHQQKGYFDMKAEGYEVASDGYTMSPEDVEAARVFTLHRFATHPHALEDE